MTLDKFNYVLTVAEERNLRKAAAKLYISQPGLTTYLNKLEQYLGIKLFNRNVNPIEITEAGSLYIARMKEIQKSESALRMTLQDMAAPKRTFRIGMGTTRGMQWLPILLPAFQKKHPDIAVNIQSGGLRDMEGGLIDGSMDIAFGAMTSVHPEITYEEIRREFIYCVVPRSTALGSRFAPNEATIYHPVVISGEDLKEECFLMPSPSNGFYFFTDRIFSQYEVNTSNKIVLNNLDTAYQLAAKGCGTLLINAFDYHRVYPQLDSKLAFCVFNIPPVYRLAKIAYKKTCANIDLVQDLKQIVEEILLPELNEGAPVFQ